MQKRKNNRLIVIGIIIVIIGWIIGMIPVVQDTYEEIVENNNIDEFIKDTTIKENKDNNQTKKSNKEPYLMVLEIPNVKIRKGIYNKDSSLNTLSKNIEILTESAYPDEDKGNVVLQAHNGRSKVAFFNDLYMLHIGDKAYIYYKGYKYTYSLNKTYDILKDGTVEIERDKDKNTLTLITCLKGTNDRQSVFILYLESKELY